MNTLRLKRLFLIILTLAFVLVGTLTAYAKTKNYYGVTWVTYTNSITDQPGGGTWTASHSDSTSSPSRQMDSIGANFWSTWCSCNGVMVQATYIGYSVQNYPWIMAHNVTSMVDSMARTKADGGGPIKLDRL